MFQFLTGRDRTISHCKDASRDTREDQSVQSSKGTVADDSRESDNFRPLKTGAAHGSDL